MRNHDGSYRLTSDCNCERGSCKVHPGGMCSHTAGIRRAFHVGRVCDECADQVGAITWTPKGSQAPTSGSEAHTDAQDRQPPTLQEQEDDMTPYVGGHK